MFRTAFFVAGIGGGGGGGGLSLTVHVHKLECLVKRLLCCIKVKVTVKVLNFS